MPKRRGSGKDSFPVVVTLAIFKYNEIDKTSSVGIVSDGYGKFGLPEKNMEDKNSSKKTAKSLAFEYILFNKLNAIDLKISSCYDKPNRYPGDAEQHLSLVYRLNIGSDANINDGIVFANPEYLAELFEAELIIKDHKKIMEFAFFNG